MKKGWGRIPQVLMCWSLAGKVASPTGILQIGNKIQWDETEKPRRRQQDWAQFGDS
jgi:hypothetical protein